MNSAGENSFVRTIGQEDARVPRHEDEAAGRRARETREGVARQRGLRRGQRGALATLFRFALCIVFHSALPLLNASVLYIALLHAAHGGRHCAALV